MLKLVVLVAILAGFLFSPLSVLRFGMTAGSNTIIVPIDFITIQEAINNATDGDMIFVYNGSYIENVVVNRTVSLFGEDCATTIIDGDGKDCAVRVDSNNVSISGFTISNSSADVKVLNANYLNVTGSALTNSQIGMLLYNSNGNNIVGNNVTSCQIGVTLEFSNDNLFRENNVTDNGDIGILLTNSQNNVLTSNRFVKNTNHGVFLNSSAKNKVEQNFFSDNGCGVRLHLGGENFIVDNDVRGSSKEGVLLYYSSGNMIEKNDLTHNAYGLKLAYSGNNTLRSNNMALNGYNLDVEAVALPSFINDIDTSNTVEGKPVYYLVNQKDLVVNSGSNAGYLAVVNSVDILVKDLNLSVNGEGALLAYSSRCTIENTSFADNHMGLYLYNSSYVQVNSNEISNNFAEGVFIYEGYENFVEDNSIMFNGIGMYLYSLTSSSVLRNNVTGNVGRGVQMLSSNFDIISQNSMSQNGLDGIYLYNSNNNTLSDNEVVGNGRDGMWIDTSAYDLLAHNNVSWNSATGIYLLTATKCQLQNNKVVGNSYVGLQLSVDANNNTLVGNSVTENVRWGINLYDCSYNKIFNNNFINRYQVQIVLGSTNFWDDGYPQGGNYWPDYGALDLFWGPYQNMTGSDGIGDAPFVIGLNNVDHYPLMSPSRLHDVAVLDATVYPTEAYVGWTVDINTAVGNVGDFVENFNVTIYAAGSSVKNFSVSNLLIGQNVKFTFSWNTSGLTPSDYIIKCESIAVASETNLENNVWLAGTVKLKMVGDVDGNGRVNILDIASLAIAFGARIGDSGYRLNKDLNRDNIINILDISMGALNFGKSISP